LTEQPLDILKKYWGYDAFRPLQAEIIESVLAGKDTLALMPTGGGKSLCFQVPALCQEGICIVVSPLIALMKDQVANLQKNNIQAVAIFSGMRYSDIDRTFDNCIYGNTKFLYLSPERLKTDLARERISQMKVNLIAVDEAHCISQWGYDFRPPYLDIAELRDIVPDTPILALTATATPEVVVDIQDKLEFKKHHVFQKSFARSNLAYVVLEEESKRPKLVDILKKVPGSGVVYVRNRKGTQDTARFLQQNGISADFYHAGLNSVQRTEKQEAWMNNKTRIIVSTNAFGMGIDKPDVRVVVHLDLPDSLEAYFQEAGRGGRDGKKSYSILLYEELDKIKLESSYITSFPPIPEIRQVYRALGSYCQLATGGGLGKSYDFDIVEFIKNFKLDAYKTFSCLKILEKEGWIMQTDAVFIPSSIKMKVGKEEVYDYQLKNPKFDLFIKTILRLTGGAFQHYVNVRENQFAQFLKIPLQELKNAFFHLHREGIIDYRPQKDQPQIIFLKARVSADDLQIDHQAYNFRKEQYRLRIRKAIEYAEKPRCRSRQLLNYFGEMDVEACGICDVCLGRTKAEISPDDYDRYKVKVQQLLKRENLTTEEIVDSFGSNRHEQVLKTLEFLLDEGLLEEVDGKLKWAGSVD